MGINKMTYYAFQIIKCIYENEFIHEMKTSIGTISEKENITNGMVVKVLSILRGNGIVESHRGVNGGYSLCEDTTSISLLKIMEIMQGEIEYNPSLNREDPAIYQNLDTVHLTLEHVNESIKSFLNNITLKEMFDKKNNMKSL